MIHLERSAMLIQESKSTARRYLSSHSALAAMLTDTSITYRYFVSYPLRDVLLGACKHIARIAESAESAAWRQEADRIIETMSTWNQSKETS